MIIHSNSFVKKIKHFFDYGGGLIDVIRNQTLFGGFYRFSRGPKHFLYNSVGIADSRIEVK
jgi:hypothetical protein